MENGKKAVKLANYRSDVQQRKQKKKMASFRTFRRHSNRENSS